MAMVRSGEQPGGGGTVGGVGGIWHLNGLPQSVQVATQLRRGRVPLRAIDHRLYITQRSQAITTVQWLRAGTDGPGTRRDRVQA